MEDKKFLTDLLFGTISAQNGGNLPDDLRISGKTEEGFPIITSDNNSCSWYVITFDLGVN